MGRKVKYSFEQKLKAVEEYISEYSGVAFAASRVSLSPFSGSS